MLLNNDYCFIIKKMKHLVKHANYFIMQLRGDAIQFTSTSLFCRTVLST